MLRVYRLDHFGVDVADLERAERFYISVLGMSVQMRRPDQVLLRYGDGNFALVLEGRPGSTTAAVSGSAPKRSPWSLMAMPNASGSLPPTEIGVWALPRSGPL